MAIRCLVMGFSPMHVILAAAAVRTLHPAADVECRVVLGEVSGLGPTDAEHLIETLRALSKALLQPISFTVVAHTWLTERTAVGLRTSLVSALHDRVGWDQADELYFCHDATGTLYQSLCIAFPAAQRVCYGDNIGLATTLEDAVAHSWPDHPRLTVPALKRLHLCRRMAARWRLDALEKIERDNWPEPGFVGRLYFPPHLYCMSLPHLDSSVGPTSDALRVVPRKVVADCLEQAAAALGVADYECRLLDQIVGSQPPVLLMTAYLFETGYIASLEKEVGLLAEAVAPLIGSRGTVFIKPHPHEIQSRIPALRKRLGAGVTVVELDRRFARVPIEAFVALCRASHVCGFSSAVLSLKHLYGIDTVQPVTPTVLKERITPSHRSMLARTVSIMDEVIARLPAWNGTGWIFRNDADPPGSGVKEGGIVENFDRLLSESGVVSVSVRASDVVG